VRYKDYVDVFSKDRAVTLEPHRPIDHAINLKPVFNLPYSRTYNLSEVELKTLRASIETILANGFIQLSSSPASAPFLFSKKKDGGLWLCVAYQALNTATLKNRYPIPLISERRDRLQGALIFTKLDLGNVYHHMRIKAGDKYKTAFHTRYGQFVYRVMPYELTNAPATFQANSDGCLRPYIDHFAVCYLDNILIYSTNAEEYEVQVRKVVEQLREFGLCGKAEKCLFGVSEVGFLGFVISPDGIAMDSDRISTIEDWPTPESVRDVHVLHGFTNLYWWFIKKYAKVRTLISDLLKKAENSRTSKQV
jgi:hypothetical protein